MKNDKIVYFLRHGETEQNRLGIVQGRGIDSVLNETGQYQAQTFYEKYKYIEFDLLIASSMQRAYQTIQAFESDKMIINRDARLDEISWGEHEGKAGEPELMEKYYKIIAEWNTGNYNAKALYAESANELKSRLDNFLKDLINADFKLALIATHGRTLRALICILKDWPLSKMDEIMHSNTGLYKLKFLNNKWEVLAENDTSHLIDIKC